MSKYRAFLSADYDEPKADKTFRGFEVSIMGDNEKDKKILFNTGDPIYDYYAYQRWMMNNGDTIFVITHSSSVDHFFMDSKKYFERHVVFNKDYSEGDLMYWQDAEKLGHSSDKLPKVMATKNMKKFSEVKAYIKAKEAADKIKVNKDMTIVLKREKAAK